MNNLQTKLIIFFSTIFIIFTMVALFFWQPRFISDLNAKLIDTAFTIRGEIAPDPRIAIVDVDERSLKELGQWPWSRNKIARILENLTQSGVAIIGLDMVFSERDKSSPFYVAKEFNLSQKELPNYDKIFAETLAKTPTITGFTFNFEAPNKMLPPNINAIYIQKNKPKEHSLLIPQGITSNIPIIQQYAYSSGSFNTFPDKDGIVRFLPLLFSYEGNIYPSLSFEMVRALLGERKVFILYDQNGVDEIKVGDLTIPTDSEGRLFINFRGKSHTYPYLSAIDIYHNRFDPTLVKDKIILLGTSAAGLLDLRATPFESVYPGVEVHANVLDNMINNDFISASSSIQGVGVVSIVMSIALTALIITFLPPLLSFGMTIGFLALEMLFLYHMLFEKHILLDFSYPILSTLSTVFVLTFVKIYFENQQKEIIKEKFAKKVSPQVAQKLLKNPKDLFTVSEEEITIFFSDIRNFTTISETLADPKVLIDYLNTYMSPMSEIIIAHEGTIDKYIGDAIMAYWNAPLAVKNHADKAVLSALEQIEALKILNQTLKQKAYPPIDIGIGLHTGVAIVGEMGSEGRSDYTVIGDSINLGSRIEGLCKTYGAKVLISQYTYEKLTHSYKIREVDRVQVKGKNEPVTLYEVLGEGVFKGKEKEINKLYLYAKRLYKEAKFQEAYALFYKAYSQQPQKLFALYMERCAAYQKQEIKDFDAIHRFTTK